MLSGSISLSDDLFVFTVLEHTVAESVALKERVGMESAGANKRAEGRGKDMTKKAREEERPQKTDRLKAASALQG